MVVTFAIAIFVSLVVARLFRQSINDILGRIVGQEIGSAWWRCLSLAIYVVGDIAPRARAPGH